MSEGQDHIMMSHGNGGSLMHDLIARVFLDQFGDPVLIEESDSAILPGMKGHIAFTTDSFVVDPLFFPGGDIGRLAVCGTVNDLAVSGARPLYLSAAFIIEEGFAIEDLRRIVRSMKEEAIRAGVRIVTGDTKVVNRGHCDKLFINTAGIGVVDPNHSDLAKGTAIRPGDCILVNGTLGDHGMAIMNSRQSFRFTTSLATDCAPLNHLITDILSRTSSVRFMRDPTRGGAATVLNEVAARCGAGIEIDEAALPVNPAVRSFCEILGYDLLYIANEGKVVLICGESECDRILGIMREHPEGREAAKIGRVTDDHPGKVILNTTMGGKRIIGMLTGDLLPRIC